MFDLFISNMFSMCLHMCLPYELVLVCVDCNSIMCVYCCCVLRICFLASYVMFVRACVRVVVCVLCARVIACCCIGLPLQRCGCSRLVLQPCVSVSPSDATNVS